MFTYAQKTPKLNASIAILACQEAQVISGSWNTFSDSCHKETEVQITDLPQMVCRGRKHSQSTGSLVVNRIKQNRRRSFVVRSVGQSSSSTC